MQDVSIRIAVVVFGLLTIAILVLAVFDEKGSLQVHAQARKLSAIESEIRKLDSENQQLTTEIQALRTDPTAIEKLAREELKLVNPAKSFWSFQRIRNSHKRAQKTQNNFVNFVPFCGYSSFPLSLRPVGIAGFFGSR